MVHRLVNLLSTSLSPPFIYLHHPHHPASQVIPSLPSNKRVAQLDTIEHHTAKLLLSGALIRFSRDEQEDIEAATWDDFTRRLREIHTGKGKGKGKGKRKAVDLEDSDGQVLDRSFVLIITKAERLRLIFGGGWAVITRVAELVSFVLAEILSLLTVVLPSVDRCPYHGCSGICASLG